MRFISGLLSLIGVAAISLVIACGDASGPQPAPPPASVVLVSGDAQPSPEVGTMLPQPLAIKVSDAQGQTLSGVSVAWSASAGALAASSSITNGSGVATIEWTLGTATGRQTATATVTGLTPVTFTATAVAGPAAQIIFSRDTVRLLGLGDVFRLNARAADRYGNTALQGTTIESADTSIVTVDDFGAGATLTARASDKTTTIRATSGTIAKTGTVIILPPPCAAGSNALSLGVGDVMLLSGAAASEFCVQGTTAGAEFIAIPYYSDFSGSLLRLSISTGNTIISATANRLASPSLQVAAATAGRLERDETFERNLRERSSAELTPRIPSARTARQNGAGRFNTAVALPAVGDLMKLNTNASNACANANYRTGRVVAITSQAIIIADTANPPNGFTTEDYQYFGVTFDTLIYPVDTLNFGAPTDIDKDQHVILFFTRAVNELTPPAQSFYVGGFFYSRDLFPTTSSGGLGGCETSNFAEMFYLLAPDPGGVVNQNVRTVNFVRTSTVGTVAHEFQHLINASRHLYMSTGGTFEDSFLDEGLAHVAEELTFYRASGLSPRQNLTYGQIQSLPGGKDAFNNFGASNFRRFREFLTSPQTNSPYAPNANITTRGAIWSFLRYAADRRTGPESEMWFQLANPPAGVRGLQNITRAVTSDLSTWVRDWAVANYADDFIPGAQPPAEHPSWNIRSVVSALNDGVWALNTQQLDVTNITSIIIADGSSAYLRFGVGAGATGGGRITARGGPVPGAFALSIIRTK